MTENLRRQDLHDEVAWIEVTWQVGPPAFDRVVKRIEMPVSIYRDEHHNELRILDQRGVVHVVPSPAAGGAITYEKVPGAEDPVEL